MRSKTKTKKTPAEKEAAANQRKKVWLFLEQARLLRDRRRTIIESLGGCPDMLVFTPLL